MDSVSLHSIGYEPRQSSLKFSGKKDDWPAFRWQFLSTITSFGGAAMEILNTKYEDLITNKISEQTKIKTEFKGTQDQKDAAIVEADKTIVALADHLMKMKNRIPWCLFN